jgi:hypothetical protein
MLLWKRIHKLSHISLEARLKKVAFGEGTFSWVRTSAVYQLINIRVTRILLLSVGTWQSCWILSDLYCYYYYYYCYYYYYYYYYCCCSSLARFLGLLFGREDGGSMYLRHVDKLIPEHGASFQKIALFCIHLYQTSYTMLTKTGTSLTHVINSNIGGWSPTGSTWHVGHQLVCCTCTGWLWGWRIWWNYDWQGKPK